MSTSEAPIASPAVRTERALAAVTLGVPPLGALAALALAMIQPVTLLDLGLCASLYAATMLGITAGYHRHATHKSFWAVRPVRAALLACGAMAWQGPLLFWAAAHRRHHQHADGPGDPHSPVDGLWHAHAGWMFHHTPEKWHQLVPDLLKDDVAFAVHRHYFVLGAAGWVAPALVGGLAAGPGGALSGFLWGGLVRTLLVHHATWCVNSICHAHGARPHETRDRSTNHALVAWLTMGEGWHNNHHASPVAARHGQGWRQPDVTWFLIESLERLGLVSEVR